MIQFPKDFVWGTATSSYQVEGAVREDGRGETIWDRFCRVPGKVRNKENGDVACNHYHLFEDDIDLMKSLNIQSYRFSVAWSRIFPEGTGSVNEKGLDFYKRMVNKLLENDIEPLLTLYHWDLPQALQDKGGWTNRDMTDYFTEYASCLYQELGDVVKKWGTHNEPWVVSYKGYSLGNSAPGYLDFRSHLMAAHHLMLSHGKAVKAFRELGPNNGEIGITLNIEPTYPLEDTEECFQAAKIKDGFQNRWFMDPVMKGKYPADMVDLYSKFESFQFIKDGDLSTISQAMDFLGVNYYSIATNKKGTDGELGFLGVESVKTGKDQTFMGWEVEPQGLVDTLLRIKKDYGDIPLYITENGAAYDDQVEEDGSIQDDDRLEFVQMHLSACKEAIVRGVNLKGYYLWSFMDNFEWRYGYSKRFGIVRVDYETLKRTPKKSAYWYKRVIEENGF
ncbi:MULTISPECIES: GH1 family beta-glucosidase [Bacillaceae]|uniref:Beta-glucosidase n=1 Tax=Evansella alkalicola TaxID=745819 RepID=A0ABS6JWV4_9BACI|nr:MULTISPECIES: GH1 family beta-glucosidase [Bacillaceae]MBU9722973.1 beta-glucosidase [Bacillus alkalicola]